MEQDYMSVPTPDDQSRYLFADSITSAELEFDAVIRRQRRRQRFARRTAFLAVAAGLALVVGMLLAGCTSHGGHHDPVASAGNHAASVAPCVDMDTSDGVHWCVIALSTDDPVYGQCDLLNTEGTITFECDPAQGWKKFHDVGEFHNCWIKPGDTSEIACGNGLRGESS